MLHKQISRIFPGVLWRRAAVAGELAFTSPIYTLKRLKRDRPD